MKHDEKIKNLKVLVDAGEAQEECVWCSTIYDYNSESAFEAHVDDSISLDEIQHGNNIIGYRVFNPDGEDPSYFINKSDAEEHYQSVEKSYATIPVDEYLYDLFSQTEYTIEAKKKFQNNGSGWVDVKIYSEGILIADNYSLSDTRLFYEEFKDVNLLEDINLIIREKIIDSEKISSEFSIHINQLDIKKGSCWDKYINIDMDIDVGSECISINDDFTISGMTQGRPRNILEFLKECDFSNMMEDLVEGLESAQYNA